MSIKIKEQSGMSNLTINSAFMPRQNEHKKMWKSAPAETQKAHVKDIAETPKSEKEYNNLYLV